MSKPPALKLVQGDDIRKVTEVPENFAGLRRVLQGLFGNADFQVKYTDEEGDPITIATDEELRLAYKSTAGPSLRLILVPKAAEPPKPESQKPKPEGKRTGEQCILKNFGRGLMDAFRRGKTEPSKDSQREAFVQQMVRQEVSRLMGLALTPVHENVKCNGCNVVPITGVRYKCTQCTDFDFCELCEADCEHPHPFLKVDRVVVGGNFAQANAGQAFVGDLTPKMEVVSQQWRGEDLVAPGEHVYRSWVVRNTGPDPWPAATRLVYQRGDVYGETVEVPCPLPNQEATIGLQLVAPVTEGRFRGCFSLVTPRGVAFGTELVTEVVVARPTAGAEVRCAR